MCGLIEKIARFWPVMITAMKRFESCEEHGKILKKQLQEETMKTTKERMKQILKWLWIKETLLMMKKTKLERKASTQQLKMVVGQGVAEKQ
ncbi:hypothetical protein PoB_006129800 [Plakobranchus ocellatus]|uniref:Uncharacterized protein n=1 Tax=Plakobranchus ocellatus TaxID=259542 RepID=A0AAV4CSD7_9GAST|nr:hypothetical protein PoB_006129800 [Plakobranchus ocellatus]